MGFLQNSAFDRKTSNNINTLAKKLESAHYEQCRWAVLRTENVENIAAKYLSNPDLVHVITDTKLAGRELVLLRKDRYEILVKIVRDLTNGQAAIHHNVEALMHATDVLTNFIEREDKLLKDTGLTSAIKLVRSVTAQLSSSVVVKQPVMEMDTAELTDEERSLLDEQE